MTNRLSLAVACLAAVGIACTGTPKSSSKDQARTVSGAKKIGRFTMTITPTAESGGRRARIEVVPDPKDGSPTTNPAGSVQVFGTFEATVTAAGGTSAAGTVNPCGVQALYAPVAVTNFAAEPLTGVKVQIINMTQTGSESCNSSPVAGVLPPADTLPGALFGFWDYGTLAGATAAGVPVNDGSAPGGATTVGWWMKYPANTPVSFNFVVWADAGQPELSPAGPQLEVGLPLAWTSAASATTLLEVCSADPVLTGGVCPAGSQALTPAAGTGVGPWSFSAIPATVAGTTYYWRAINTFSGVTANYASNWDSFLAVAPFAPASPVIVGPAPVGVPPAVLAQFPADSLATATPIPIDWTTGLDSFVTHIQICDTVDCLPAGAAAGLLDEAWEFGTLDVAGFTYTFDALASLPADPASGFNWLLPGTYYVNVYNWDDVNGVDVGAPAVSAFDVVIVGAPPPFLVSPLPGQPVQQDNLALGVPVELSWLTDAAVPNAQWQLCSALPCPGAAGVNLLAQGIAVGVAPAIGDPYAYTVNVIDLLPTDPAAGDFWLLPGTYYWQVTNIEAGIPAGTPSASSFVVVSSMPLPPALTAPANGTAFPANTFTNGLPIGLSWTSPTSVSSTEVDLCALADCTGPFDPLATLFVPENTPGSATYSYDAAATPDVPEDFLNAPFGGYLTVGTFYWTVYNVDTVTGARLVPGQQASFVITPVAVGPTAFTLEPTANLSRAAGPIPLSWSGPPELLATTVEFYEDVGMTFMAATLIVADDGTLQPTASHFTVADLRPDLTLDQPYWWRVVDDGLALYYFGVPDPSAWSAQGSFTIAP